MKAIDRPPQTGIMAGAGIVGPVLFTVGFLVQGVRRRGGYDPMAE